MYAKELFVRRLSVLLILLTAFAVGLGACRNGARERDIPESSPGDEQVVAPLTGMPVEDEAVLDRPVVALKIDNNRKARPQRGLGQADVRVTEIVEGGLTRFIAIFHSTDPGVVGPIRSARPVDTLLLPAYSPVFAFSGAADPTWETLRESELVTVADDVPRQREAAGFTRDSDRPRPHNLFVEAENLWGLEQADNLPAPEQTWNFNPEPPDGGRRAVAMSMAYSPSAEAAWEWDDGDERWVRAIRGEPHVDADGDRLGAENVIVVRTEDPEGHSVVGTGEAVVFRDGRTYQAEWRKPTADSHFRWVDSDGQPLSLRPGSTWIELVPQDGRLEVARPSNDG